MNSNDITKGKTNALLVITSLDASVILLFFFFPYYIVILCTSLVSISVKAKQRNWNKAIISQLWLHINEQILDYIR